MVVINTPNIKGKIQHFFFNVDVSVNDKRSHLKQYILQSVSALLARVHEKESSASSANKARTEEFITSIDYI